MSKRKQPELPPAAAAEKTILNVIKARKDVGIWLRDIKQESKLPDSTVNKTIKLLTEKNLIKLVTNFQFKGRKYYMATEFQPSKEITGGDWYSEGSLDMELVGVLKRMCRQILTSEKVTTAQGVHIAMKKMNALKFEITCHQVEEILKSMVLDNEIIEVKSNGMGDYFRTPIGTICYRFPPSGAAKGPRVGAFASIPCGACPRISMCTPGGAISPTNCVYYNQWLDIEF